MKCLFVAVFNKSSTNYSQALCLEEAGCEVIRFGYRKMAEGIGNEDRDKILIETIRHEKPDFVLYSKCNGVSSKVITRTQKVCKHILWYMDPLNGNFDVELKDKIVLCDASVFALQRPMESARSIKPTCHFVHEGFDPYVDYPREMEKKYDVSFIGNVDARRQKFIDGYPDIALPRGFSEDFSKIVSQSKINLNFVRNDSGCSDRVYRVLANGGFLLTEPWPGMEEDFTPDRDFAVFNSPDEMLELILRYRDNEEDQFTMDRISCLGLNTVQQFSRHNWAKRIIEIAGVA